jgi:tryptophan halogenase
MTAEAVRRIVIVGDGVAAWMAAAALTEVLNPAECSISVLGAGRSGSGAPPPDLADAILPLPDNDRLAQEPEEDWIVTGSGGAFTYGIALSGWSAPGATWFHHFGPTGANLGPAGFHHLAMRLRREGTPLRLADYSLAALAAQAGRFARPGPDPRSVLQTCRYGLHLDGERLAEVLARSAVAAQVRRLAGHYSRAERAEDGFIAAVVSDNGERHEGDLFLDCTGDAAELAGDGPDTDWDDWSAWLSCDRRLSASVTSRLPPPPYSHAAAHEAGWVRQLPLQGRMALSSFYCADFSDGEQALANLRSAAGGAGLADVRDCAIRFGRRRLAWHRNCIALGRAAAIIDPVGSNDLHLLRCAVNRLVQLLPGDRKATAEAAEYNRRTAQQLDNARDFAILHYKLNGRHGEAFWDACRAISVPSSLTYRMNLYESLGRVAMYDDEPLEDVSWISLFDEHGVRPRHYSPIADGFSAGDLQRHVARVREIMIDELRRMPLHADYLAGLDDAARRASGAADEPTT